MTATDEKPLLSWDGDEEDPEYEWECLVESLSEAMERINPDFKPWVAIVNNFGWRSTNGHKIFQAMEGGKLLSQILPDTQNSFKIYLSLKDRKISVNNSHHDAPTGNEWYYITPADECAWCGKVINVVKDDEIMLEDGAQITGEGPMCKECIEEWVADKGVKP